MFHAVGLNAIDATERSKEDLEKSTSVDNELAMAGVFGIVVKVVNVV